MKRGRHLSITAKELLQIGRSRFGTDILNRIGGLKIDISAEKFDTPESEKLRRKQLALGVIYSFTSKVIEDNASSEEEQKQYWEKLIELIKLLVKVK